MLGGCLQQVSKGGTGVQKPNELAHSGEKNGNQSGKELQSPASYKIQLITSQKPGFLHGDISV